MKHTDLYRKYKELETIERRELRRAVLAHGGEFKFANEEGEEKEGLQMPIVSACPKHWDNMGDFYVTRIVVNGAYLFIYGRSIDSPYIEMLLDDIALGHIDYIIDEIPETEEVKDVTILNKVDIVPVITLGRTEIENAGFEPNITDDELKAIANRIAKSLDLQGFSAMFLENIKEACQYVDIAPLQNNDCIE